MWNDNEETRRGDDLKQWKKDRQRLFKENGNGWWWFQKKKEGR